MNLWMADAGLEVILNGRTGQLHGSIQDQIWGRFVKLAISELLIESFPSTLARWSVPINRLTKPLTERGQAALAFDKRSNETNEPYAAACSITVEEGQHFSLKGCRGLEIFASHLKISVVYSLQDPLNLEAQA
jgi:hypothetical protein